MEEKVIVRYDKSHTAKLSLLSDKMKDIYVKVKNELLSYDSVKVRLSWNKERFYIGKETIANLAVRGKILRVYLELDPKKYENDFAVIDCSDIKKYVDTPTLFKIKGPRSFKTFLSLLEKFTDELDLEEADKKTTDTYEQLLRSRTFEELLNEELIKPVYGNASENKAVENFLVDDEDDEDEEEEVLYEVDMSDMTTYQDSTFTVEGLSKEAVGRSLRTIINLNTLDNNFNDGDIVDLEALKEKGLIKPYIMYVKVLADGNLTKTLDIRLNAYSFNAINKIRA